MNFPTMHAREAERLPHVDLKRGILPDIGRKDTERRILREMAQERTSLFSVRQQQKRGPNLYGRHHYKPRGGQ